MYQYLESGLKEEDYKKEKEENVNDMNQINIGKYKSLSDIDMAFDKILDGDKTIDYGKEVYQNTINFNNHLYDGENGISNKNKEIKLTCEKKNKPGEIKAVSYSDNLKPNIYKKFPGLLSHKYDPVLISELNKLGYEFKWIGNSFAACSRYNYRYCLSEKKEEYLDLYLLQAFLQKTPPNEHDKQIIYPNDALV